MYRLLLEYSKKIKLTSPLPFVSRGSGPKIAKFSNGLYGEKVARLVVFTHLMVFLKFGLKVVVVWGTSDSLYLRILSKVCSEIYAFIMRNYLPIILILTALTNRTIATMTMTPQLPSRELMQQHVRHYHTDKMFPVQRGYLSRIVCFKRGLQALSW
jgi:hypothetical protein